MTFEMTIIVLLIIVVLGFVAGFLFSYGKGQGWW